MILSYLAVIIGFCQFSVRGQFSDPIVNLPYGTLRGYTDTTITGKVYHNFMQIPYAAPPIGTLRFELPQPPIPWEGVREAKQFHSICYQLGLDLPGETEDCLLLNVYTPALPEEGKPLLPVMFFIHGGGFFFGSSRKLIYGPDYIVEKDVVLITINYRLGVFGFLSTMDEILPGNYGLEDQQFAMKWTKQYVSYFGGDPYKITIFGESAGSASVSYQMLNPKSQGLYRAAICESGSAMSPWAFQRDAKNIAFGTASLINYTFSFNRNSQDLKNYLQSVDANVLNVIALQYTLRNFAALDFSHGITQGFVWAPVKHDNSFVTENMYVSFKEGRFNQVPTILSINSEEAIFLALVLPLLQIISANYDLHPDMLVPDDMGITNFADKLIVGKEICDIYTRGAPFVLNPGDIIRFLSDTVIIKSTIKQAELQANQPGMQVYFAQFSYRGLVGSDAITLQNAGLVAHGEELRYLFKLIFANFNDPLLNKPDLDIQNLMVTMWTDFAKTLNPTPAGSYHGIVWPTLNSGQSTEFLYLNINVTSTIENHPRNDTYPKWVALYDQSPAYDNFDTY